MSKSKNVVPSDLYFVTDKGRLTGEKITVQAGVEKVGKQWFVPENGALRGTSLRAQGLAVLLAHCGEQFTRDEAIAALGTAYLGNRKTPASRLSAFVRAELVAIV